MTVECLVILICFGYKGIRTIGYGHACHAADCSKIHAPISQAQGEALLHSDLVRFESCVEAHGHLDDAKFAALVSFVFNLGCGTLNDFSAALKAHNYKSVASQMLKYTHAGGRVLAGLVRRRNAEHALFCSTGGC